MGPMQPASVARTSLLCLNHSHVLGAMDLHHASETASSATDAAMFVLCKENNG